MAQQASAGTETQEEQNLRETIMKTLQTSQGSSFVPANKEPATASSNIDPNLGQTNGQAQAAQTQQTQQTPIPPPIITQATPSPGVAQQVPVTPNQASSGEDDASSKRGPRRELSTSKRAAQNRAAQRAFRQRKEEYIKKLERQVNDFVNMQESYKQIQAENSQLRDYIIHLQNRIIDSHGKDQLPPPPAVFTHPTPAYPISDEPQPQPPSKITDLAMTALSALKPTTTVAVPAPAPAAATTSTTTTQAPATPAAAAVPAPTAAMGTKRPLETESPASATGTDQNATFLQSIAQAAGREGGSGFVHTPGVPIKPLSAGPAAKRTRTAAKAAAEGEKA